MKRNVRCRSPVNLDSPAFSSCPCAGHDAVCSSTLVEGSVFVAHNISQLPLEGDNAWLRAAHRAAVESPDSNAARRKPYGDQTFPKILARRAGWSAVLGRNAFKEAGRLRCGPTCR